MRAPAHLAVRGLSGLEGGAGADFENRAPVGRTRIDRSSDIETQRPERRLPANAESVGSLQALGIHALLQGIGLAGVAEDHAPKTQARQNREGDLVAENQHLAAADVLHTDGLAGGVEYSDQRPQRIELIAAHIISARDAAREEALVEGQVPCASAAQIGADAEGNPLRRDPGPPGLTLQKGIVVASV